MFDMKILRKQLRFFNLYR